MANFLLKVVLSVDDPSGPVMETFHHTSLHVGQMMGLKVEIPVHVYGLPVDRDFRPISFLLLSSVSQGKGVLHLLPVSTVNLMVGLTPLR